MQQLIITELLVITFMLINLCTPLWCLKIIENKVFLRAITTESLINMEESHKNKNMKSKVRKLRKKIEQNPTS